jgi:hypothetical protein
LSVHLLRREAKKEEVLATDVFPDLDVRPVGVPIVSAPFMPNFMLPVPEASLPAVEICSLRSAAGRCAAF